MLVFFFQAEECIRDSSVTGVQTCALPISAYAESWLEVCRRLSTVRFWIPTRAWQQPSGLLPVFDPLLAVLRKLAALPNVTVRPSALNFGDLPPVVAGLHAGSTAEYSDIAREKECP